MLSRQSKSDPVAAVGCAQPKVQNPTDAGSPAIYREEHRTQKSDSCSFLFMSLLQSIRTTRSLP